jgi:hypothetical protein
MNFCVLLQVLFSAFNVAHSVIYAFKYVQGTVHSEGYIQKYIIVIIIRHRYTHSYKSIHAYICNMSLCAEFIARCPISVCHSFYTNVKFLTEQK